MLIRLLALTALLGSAPFAHASDIKLAEQLQEGGAAVIATLGLSVLFVAVSIERLLHLRTRAIVPSGLADRADTLWKTQDVAMLEVTAKESDSTLGRVILYLAAHRGQPHGYVSSGAGDIASLELRHHQQKFYALSIVATVAPIVGLLGTVLGMIDAFHVIAYAGGMGNPTLLAAGISKALVNTAAGLAVALPALGMHHFFKHRLAILGLALEKQINGLLQAWFEPAAATGPTLQVVHHAH